MFARFPVKTAQNPVYVPEKHNRITVNCVKNPSTVYTGINGMKYSYTVGNPIVDDEIHCEAIRSQQFTNEHFS